MAKWKYKDTIHRFEPDNSGGGAAGLIIGVIVFVLLLASCAG